MGYKANLSNIKAEQSTNKIHLFIYVNTNISGTLLFQWKTAPSPRGEREIHAPRWTHDTVLRNLC